MRCSSCGSESSGGARFCAHCGAPLALDDSPPLEGERRLVTVLFADVVGFTALAETLDPEPLRDLLNDLFDRLVPCVQRHAGTVDKFIGDCLMAVFGAPVSHDNDAARAIRAALEMQETVTGFAAERGLELALHVGINTGRVVAGGVGGGGRQEYSVVGDAVNVASRLEEGSAPGEILVGPDTQRLVEREFESEAAGAMSVRGRAEAVTAYRIITEPSRGTRASGVRRAALVGRDGELAACLAALQRVADGQGGVLFVVGEPGLGKSRLTAEVRRRCTREVTWLEGRALSFGRTLGYLPFREILETDAGIYPDDDAPTRAVKLGLRVGELVPVSALPVRSHLANLLSLPVPSPFADRLRDLRENALRRELFACVGEYLARLAQTRPLVLVFEDVHWLDSSSVSLIDHLLPLSLADPILFVLVGRSGAGSTTTHLRQRAERRLSGGCEHVVLSPLSSGDTARLVCDLLGREVLPPGFEEVVETRAEGNPFFVEEIVRHLVDAGGLQQDPEGKWRMTSLASEAAIPATLQGVIAARVDRLPAEVKQCLRQASVVGRTFNRRVLLELSELPPPALDDALARLESLQLIHPKRTVPELEYAFKHALVQETAYESILRQQRRALHRKTARAIEKLYDDRIEDLYGLLAYHYTKAEDWARAEDLLIRAGERAASMAADAEAIEHYRQAMGALAHTFEGPKQAAEFGDAVEWFVKRTEPFWDAGRLGDLFESVRIFHEKVRAARGPDDPRTLAAASILGAAYASLGRYSSAATVLESALERCDRLAACPTSVVTRTLLLLGVTRLSQDRFAEGEALLERALSIELSSDEPDEAMLQDVYLNLSTACYFTGHFDRIIPLVEQALARPSVPGMTLHSKLLINLSATRLIFGEYDAAEACARRCLAEKVGPYNRALADAHLAAALHAEGAYEEAETCLLEALEAFRSLAREVDALHTLVDLAETQLQRGATRAAEESARQGLRLLRKVHEAPHLGMERAYWTLAGVALTRGRLGQADRLLARSLVLAREKLSAGDPFQAEVLFRRACLRRKQGHDIEAQNDFKSAASILRRLAEEHPRVRSMTAEWAPSVL